MKGQFSMKLRDELDTLLHRTLGENSAEFASAVTVTEKTIRDARLVETALREGEVFPDFSLPDPTGTVVRSADLLALGPLIVSFYRGGWCPVCNLELNALQLALPEIEELGGALVGISPETSEQISNTLTRFSLSFYLLSAQLLIFPFVPRLMKRFDLRLIIFAGELIFGGSCLLNIHMNPEFGGPQFQIANLVRALGQPRTIVLYRCLLPLGYSKNNRLTDRLFSIS